MYLINDFRYGIGMIYYKQDNFPLAKLHFQLALKINPRNSVLLGHLAVVGTPSNLLFVYHGIYFIMYKYEAPNSREVLLLH